MGSACWSSSKRQLLILDLLVPAYQPFGWLMLTTIQARIFKTCLYSWVLCSKDTGLGFQYYLLFIPLQALMASLEPGDDAVTPAPGGWDLHPHGHLIIMVLSACASI